MRTLALTLALLAAPGIRAQDQELVLEHFVQSGTALEASLGGAGDRPGARICCGGIAAAAGEQRPSQESLSDWLFGVQALAAAAADLAFWTEVAHDQLPVVATNARDRDGNPIGRAFVVVRGSGVDVALLAVITRRAPAGFHLDDPIMAIESALPAAREHASRTLVVVDGDERAARRLLEAVPALDGALVAGALRRGPELGDVGGRFVARCPQSGTAFGRLTLQLVDGRLRAVAHRYAQAYLDVYVRERDERARAVLAPRAPEAVDAGDDFAVEPLGLAGHGVAAASVDAAIERGAAFLWQQIRDEVGGGSARLGSTSDHVLIALALVHAGLHRREQAFDDALRDLLRHREVHTLGTYSAGAFCMLIEAYGRPEFYGRLREAARYLVEGQAASGSWTYAPGVAAALCTDPDRRVLQVSGGAEPDPALPEEWRRQTPWNRHQSGDHSITQFALLGLRSAQRLGVPVPVETWARAEGYYRRGQRAHGGFGYGTDGSDVYGSMTLAGACGIAICVHERGSLEFAADPAVRRALSWLRARFSVSRNPENGSYNHYYLYSLERAGRIFDREVVAGHEWYPLGVQHLLAGQRSDGSWDDTRGGEPPRLATSFALLFLTRATERLYEERKHGGEGELATAVHAPHDSKLYVVLDASGSMLEPIGDGARTKFDVARDAVGELLAALPSSLQVGLRVYGHRRRALEPGADEDTELLVPLGSLDYEAALAALRALRARGKTPLARSLREAATDLRSASGPATVLLLTDGGEDSLPRLDPVAAAAELGKVPGLVLHVVGFDIRRDDWRAQLEGIARAGGGRYWPAGGGDLAAELRAAVLRAPAGFLVRDDAGAVVHEGRFGERVRLREGRYRFETELGGRAFAAELAIGTEATTSVVFDGSHALAVAAPVDGAACASCGATLVPGARFCSGCGAKLK